MNATLVLKELKESCKSKLKIERIWYKLLTKENYYQHCKFVNFICLKFLNRSLNDCVIEAEVFSLEQIQASGKPLKDENAEKLHFIASNGLHPLVSMSLVDDMLDNHFGKNCHFTLAYIKWFISKTIDRQFQCARNMPNFLQW